MFIISSYLTFIFILSGFSFRRCFPISSYKVLGSLFFFKNLFYLFYRSYFFNYWIWSDHTVGKILQIFFICWKISLCISSLFDVTISYNLTFKTNWTTTLYYTNSLTPLGVLPMVNYRIHQQNVLSLYLNNIMIIITYLITHDFYTYLFILGIT